MNMKMYLPFLMVSLLMTQHKSWGLAPPAVGLLPKQSFLYIENNKNDHVYILNFEAYLENQLGGANAWTEQKGITQFTLAKTSADMKTRNPSGFNLDMWETGPISHPYITQACSIKTANCTNDGKSPEHPQVVDEQGFYGLMNLSVQETAARVSPSFLNYLKTMRIGEELNREMNRCVTSEPYDARRGQRCKDMSTGTWSIHRATNIKYAHLKMIPVTGTDTIMVDSAGNPTVMPGSTNCKPYSHVTPGRDSNGVLCHIFDYQLEHFSDGGRLTTTGVIGVRNKYPNPELKPYDSALYINSSAFVGPHNPIGINLIFLKGRSSASVFFTKKYFSEYIKTNSSRPVTETMEFFIKNLIQPDLGDYIIDSSLQIDIKPRRYSVSILSSDGVATPYRNGMIGKDILSFPYKVVESGPESADRLEITLAQDRGTPFQGTCTFYPTNIVSNRVAVPIEAYLNFNNASPVRNAKIPIGCDQTPVNLREFNIRDSEPKIHWTDPDGSSGITRSYLLNLEFDLTGRQAQKTVSGESWEGEVHQSGTLTIKGSWR